MSPHRNSPKPARSVLFTVFIALVFLTGALPTPAGDLTRPAQAQTLPPLAVVDSTYSTQVATIHGEDAYAYVRMVAPTGTTSTEQRDMVKGVEVTTTVAAVSYKITIDLLETGPETNVYHGGFGFTVTPASIVDPDNHALYGRIGVDTTGAPKPGKIPVSNGVDVNIKSGSLTTKVVWKASNDIVVTIEDKAGTPIHAGAAAPFLGTTAILSFEIVDPDLNLVAAQETREDLVHVTTDSDPVGKFATLTETLPTATPGTFTASMGFRTTEVAGPGQANTVFVRHGDQIFASVIDERDKAGDRIQNRFPTAGSWTFGLASSGQVLFDRATYVGDTNGVATTGLDRATITVLDADPNASGAADTIPPAVGASNAVALTYTNGAGAVVSFTPTLLELPGSAVGTVSAFVATIGFNCGTSTPATVQCLPGGIRDGSTIRAVYTDSPSASGQALAAAPATATWRAAQAGEVKISTYAPLSLQSLLLFGTTAPVALTVTDSDANRLSTARENIVVQAKSSTNPTGVAITLEETSANSGVFTGTLEFSATSSTTKLHVTDKDRITAHYDDPADQFGKAVRVAANDGVFAIWRAETVATVTIGAANYYLQKANLADTTYTTRADVFIQDANRNHPLIRDTIDATAVRLTTPVVTSTITLTETGIDTGLFHGFVRFDDASAASPTGSLAVPGATAQFTVEYDDVRVVGGASDSRTATTSTAWRSIAQDSNAIIQFENSRTGWPQRANVFHIEAEHRGPAPVATPQRTIQIAAYAPAGAGSLTAKLESTVCTQGTAVGGANEHREVTLTESTATPGRYTAPYVIQRHSTSNACPTDHPATGTAILRVPVATSFTAQVTLPTTGAVVQTNAQVRDDVSDAVRFVGADGTTDVERASGLNQVVQLRLTGSQHNFNSNVRDWLVQPVLGEGGAVATNIVLFETGPDTAIFLGAFSFDQGGPSDALQKVHVRDVPRLKLPGSTYNTENFDTYKMYSGAEAVTPTGAKDTLSWWNGADASLTAVEQGVGSRPFKVTLTDSDALANRKFEVKPTAAGTTAFAFASGPHVVGSELVFVSASKADPQTADAATYEVTIVTSTTNGPSEGVADRNMDGRLTCQDVTLTGNIATTSGLGTTNTPLTSAQMKCVSIVASGADWKVTYSFTDRYGKKTCTPAGGLAGQGTTCTATVKTWFRPTLVSTCPSTGATPHEYRRDGATMRFCAAPPTGQEVLLTYLLAQRQMVARSLDATGTVLETETVNAVYDTNDDGTVTIPWTFSASIPTQTSATANDGSVHVAGQKTRVEFTYADPTAGFDSAAGSADRNHLRGVRAVDDWRAAATATVRVMSNDFGAQATAPVFGPSIPVEIVDSDSDTSPTIDLIQVTGTGLTSSPFTLIETGANTGIFRGVGTTAAATTSITLTYTDPHDAAGAPVPARRTMTTTFAEKGELHLGLSASRTAAGSPVFTTPATSTTHVTGSQGKLFVSIKDADANVQPTVHDTVQVQLRSDSERDGPLVTLTETGISTGIFVSSGIEFEPAPLAGNNLLFARDTIGLSTGWDRVWGEYTDLNDGAGNRVVVRPTGGGGYTHWDHQFDGLVSLEQTFGIGTAATATGCTPVLSCAHLTIADGDANRDARRVDQLTVSATDLVIGRVSTAGAFVATPPAQVLTYLVETSANSGIFIGFATFTTLAANQGQTATALGQIAATNAGTIRAVYEDSTPAVAPATVGATTPFDSTAQWFTPNHGIVGFDKRGYGATSEPIGVRLYDANAGTATTRTIRVTSGADPTGIDVTLTQERPGFWKGTMSVAQTATSGKLLVRDSDTIRATYTDTSPAGTRVATAVIAIDDETAPITSLATSPAVPNGANGWFKTAPTITLTANEPVASTRFILDGGAERAYTGPIAIATEGEHTLKYWSVDFRPNTETQKTATIKFDATAPAVSVTGIKATSAPAGAITLSWDPASAKTDPLEFGSYFIYKGTTATVLGNATTESFTTTPASDGTHTYLVAVADMAGNVDTTKAVSVPGTSDRIAPRLLTGTVTPDELFEEIDLDLTVTMTATVNSDDLADVNKVETVILDPLGESVTNVTMTREGTTNVWKGTFDDFSISGLYQFKLSALDLAGNAGTITQTVRFHAIDRAAPVIAVPPTVVKGSPLNVVITENDKGLASISYKIDGGAATVVPVTGTAPVLTQTVAIPTGSLSLGAHTVTFDVADANDPPNSATYTVAFEVTDGTGTAPPTTTAKPTVRAIRPLAAFGGVLPLAVQSSSPLTAFTVAFDTGTPQDSILRWTSSSAPAEISVAGLAPGSHIAHVVATNVAGATSADITFHVLESGVPLPPGSIIVTKGADGFPKITFVASTSDNVGGYLVHRKASPFEVIAVLGPDAREYTDKSADRSKTYTYAVTAYGTGGEGRLAKGTASETSFPWLSEVQSSAFTVEEPASNFWTWFWVILILLVVIVAVVVLVMYREQIFRDRKRDEYDDEYPDDPDAGGAFGLQQHDLRCPNCTTEFSVSGEKPIVTTCPQCGKKGILR